jgi:glutamate-1-semialdehyde 2,1-aminomutase
VTIPGFTSTGSKRPDALYGSESDCPRRFVRAEGCRVWDEEGREYLDLVMGLGSVALGYGFPDVTAAAERAVRSGVVGPLPHVVEQELAEHLAAVIPGAESVRFLKTGAEAVAAAVRIARTHTGRERVINCGYHGWLDWCQDSPGIPQSITELRREVPFGDLDAIRIAVDDSGPVAAIVIEPVIENEPEIEWLQLARELASKSGAVLIFDEIKTAFRIAAGGAAERYGVVPDMAVVGKGLGNGFPIAAVCGSEDVMDAVNRTWISSTLATEHVSLTAALAVLKVYENADVIGFLRARGESLMEGLNSIAKSLGHDRAVAKGIPQMCYLDFAEAELSAVFAAQAAKRGVIFKRNAYNFVSFAHTDEIVRDIVARLEDTADEVKRTC